LQTVFSLRAANTSATNSGDDVAHNGGEDIAREDIASKVTEAMASLQSDKQKGEAEAKQIMHAATLSFCLAGAIVDVASFGATAGAFTAHCIATAGAVGIFGVAQSAVELLQQKADMRTMIQCVMVACSFPLDQARLDTVFPLPPHSGDSIEVGDPEDGV